MKRRVLFMLASMLLTTFLGTPALAEARNTPFIRWAELEVDAGQLAAFEAAAREHVDAAIQSEPGLLALHVTQEADRPTHVRVFEMYANESAYQAHLASPHFKRFVAATQAMITARQLFTAIPIRADGKPLGEGGAFPQVRVADLQIDPERMAEYRAAVTEEIDTSMKTEPGVRAIYAMALASDPGALRFFEIYADEAAYQSHIASPHFRKYVEATKDLITARRLTLTKPIVLQSKPIAATP